jgi:CRISPR/Cas system-associated protein Cas5 (RAMP superfamily)
MKFSAIFRPTALFSLRDSNSTSSGAKSLLLPSPYAIKMAFLSQAISIGGEDFNKRSDLFCIVRDAKISYRIEGYFCVNNCFIKIQRQKDNNPFKPTVSFREYVFINGNIEFIFDVEKFEDIIFMKKYLYAINYFGKKECFFQFIEYKDIPSEPNVKEFDSEHLYPGIIQEFDDFNHSLYFDNVNSYSETKTKRDKCILVLPLTCISSSKSYTNYAIIL